MMVEWDFLCSKVEMCHALVNQDQFEHYCSKPWGHQSKRCPQNAKFGERILPKAWVKKYVKKYRTPEGKVE